MWRPSRAVFRRWPPAGCFRPRATVPVVVVAPVELAGPSSRRATIPTLCAAWRPSTTTTTSALATSEFSLFWGFFSFLWGKLIRFHCVVFHNCSQSSVKNPFLEPKMRINQPKSFIENSLVVGSKKGSPITSTQVSPWSIMSPLSTVACRGKEN